MRSYYGRPTRSRLAQQPRLVLATVQSVERAARDESEALSRPRYAAYSTRQASRPPTTSVLFTFRQN